jgi:hypothetical protein
MTGYEKLDTATRKAKGQTLRSTTETSQAS